MRLHGTRRQERPDLPVGRGERLLAWATTPDGRTVGGTRDALYLPERIPWEQVEGADWDSEAGNLRVSEVGTWGRPRPQHVLTLADPTRLLQLVRERVTASVVLQRHVAVDSRRGLRVIARRAPNAASAVSGLTWLFELDEGLDPDDPEVRRLADEALRVARADVGLD